MRRKGFILLPVLCGLLAVFPPWAAAQPAATVVTGIVLDGVTEAPIAGARVAGGGRAAATDRDGRFEIVLDGGAASLRFEADGYLETSVEVDRSAGQGRWSRGAARFGARLWPGGRLRATRPGCGGRSRDRAGA